MRTGRDRLTKVLSWLLTLALIAGSVPALLVFAQEQESEILCETEESALEEGESEEGAWTAEIGETGTEWTEEISAVEAAREEDAGIWEEEEQIIGEAALEPLYSDEEGQNVPLEGQRMAPTAVGEKVNGMLDSYQVIAVDAAEESYVQNITGVAVNGTAWERTDYLGTLFRRQAYYPDGENNKIFFDGQGTGMLTSGDIITVSNPDYEDLLLRVTESGENFAAEPYDPLSGPVKEGASDGTHTLHIRLVGSFEAAVTGQLKYDAISGASTSVSANKNSDVIVQAAVLPDGEEPDEGDWTLLHETVRVDTTGTMVNIDTENSGMRGVYSTYDSSLTLSGSKVGAAGSYPVSVTVMDEKGRVATSNELIFKVYGGNEKLNDQLKLENAKQTADGKYMWDMEPWVITEFGGADETVTVPADIKAWYGSHTSGTYGELGYAVAGNPVQTLIIPQGCDLTLVNMKIFSSVRIVVENGGKLLLRDSSIHGIIQIEDGGAFSMNYDSYSQNFLTGASINGQLILKSGALLENSLIYSNTNSLANGNQARRNVAPVVSVQGNVSVLGEVYIRGDEAPTGTNPATGKSYSGQPALGVRNGTLTIGQGSMLAVYGGGKDATTSVGGTALVLENGEITGEGMLVAVGGNGSFDDGGDAVSGNGSISTGSVYLEGGNSYLPKDESVRAGKAVSESVVISENTLKKVIDGKIVTNNSQTTDRGSYWSGTSKPEIDYDELIKDTAGGNDTVPDTDDGETHPPVEGDDPPDTGGNESGSQGTGISGGGNGSSGVGSGSLAEGGNGSNSPTPGVNTGNGGGSSGNSAVGQGSVKVTVKNVTKLKVKSTVKKKIQVTWKKRSGISGYEIQYARSKRFKNAVIKKVGAKKTSYTIKKLRSKKTYYVRIRTYKKVSGKKYYSGWSKAKKIKVK